MHTKHYVDDRIREAKNNEIHNQKLKMEKSPRKKVRHSGSQGKLARHDFLKWMNIRMRDLTH